MGNIHTVGPNEALIVSGEFGSIIFLMKRLTNVENSSKLTLGNIQLISIVDVLI